MKKLIVILLTLFTVNANAAILVMSPNGTYTTKTTLEAARTALDVANKTVVVTSALTEAQSNITTAWPVDRALKIEKGGSINNTTAFTVDGPFEAGPYKVFAGARSYTWTYATGTLAFGSEYGSVVLNNVFGKVYPQWWGAKGDGVADDSKAIQEALNTGKDVYIFDGRYLLNQGLFKTKSNNIQHAGKNTTFVLNSSSGPYNCVYTVRSPTKATYNITDTSLALGATSITVDTADGLVVGETVQIFYDIDPYDGNQPILRYFVEITNITGTVITFNRPIPEALTIVGKPTAKHTLVSFTEVVENFSISDFSVDYTTGTIPDVYIIFERCRNIEFYNMHSIRTPGILFEYRDSENINAYNIYASKKTQAHAAGRIFGGWGFRNCSLKNSIFDVGTGSIFYFESQTRGMLFDNVTVNSTHSVAEAASTTVFYASGGCKPITVLNCTVNNANALAISNDFEAAEVWFDNLIVNKTVSVFRLDRIINTFTYLGVKYANKQTVTRRFKIPYNSTIAPPVLKGYISNIKAYVLSTTGLTAFAIENADGFSTPRLSSLVAGQMVDVTGADWRNIGTQHTGNTGNVQKKVGISGNTSVPADSYIAFKIEYFAVDNDDAKLAAYDYQVTLFDKRIAYNAATPTTGTWGVGDHVFNSSPAVGQPKGWICTVPGTPGTWASEGNL